MNNAVMKNMSIRVFVICNLSESNLREFVLLYKMADENRAEERSDYNGYNYGKKILSS